MLAYPRSSCIVLVNLTRRAAARAGDAFAAHCGGSLSLLSICHEVFAISPIAIGEYERASLAGQLVASIESLDIDALSMWRDPQFVERLARSDAGVIFLGGGFLEEEVLILALEGARLGYDIRLLSDLSWARHESDRALVLGRLAHHGILATTIGQTLFEWAASLGDLTVRRRIQELLSEVAPAASHSSQAGLS